MRLFLIQLRGEMRKLFARKRTYLGFGAFLAFEVVLLFLLRLDKVQAAFGRVVTNAGYEASDYFSGLTIGFLIVVWTVFLLQALFLALVAGDIVSKEVEDGIPADDLVSPHFSRKNPASERISLRLLYFFPHGICD